MLNIAIIIGTRPNFIKVTQFKSLAKQLGNIDIQLIHTGQHYDPKMTDVFFDQLKLYPDQYLNITPASATHQMGEIMMKLDELYREKPKPDIMMVVGDVNSTLAAALAARKLDIPLAHLESGLRSNDWSMPEEINRILTDKITDYYFVTESSGEANLLSEGVPASKIFFVGNTMIDTLVAYQKQISASSVIEELHLENTPFALMTMHRPATVDCQPGLEKLFDVIDYITRTSTLVFPIHPRTLGNIKKFGLSDRLESNKKILITPPLDYFGFQKLIEQCKYVITDSGGIQEESTFLLKPCLTLRPNTERPVTCDIGTNKLVPFEPDLIAENIKSIENGTYKKGSIPPLWDGRATDRILDILSRLA